MKLLLVDDEPLARARLRRLLEARSDCDELREAANGAEAITVNAEFEPDVILLDIRMPGTSGVDAVRALFRLRAGWRETAPRDPPLLARPAPAPAVSGWR